MLLTQSSIQHVASNTTKTAELIRACIARSNTRLTELAVVGNFDKGMLRTVEDTCMIEETKSIKTSGTVLTIKTN